MTQSQLDDDGLSFEVGVDPASLADDDLFRELASLHRTRLNALRHGPDAALANHFKRTADLETEYMTRYPGREVDPARLTQDF
jgi:LPS sulfotransferase NodH